MTKTDSSDSAVKTYLDLVVTKPGKLGIEFRQTGSPYIVVRVSDEAHQLYKVSPEDKLVGVRKESETDWTSTDGLPWSQLIEYLKPRPAYARFQRSNVAAVVEPKPLPELPNIPPSSPKKVIAVAPSVQSPKSVMERPAVALKETPLPATISKPAALPPVEISKPAVNPPVDIPKPRQPEPSAFPRTPSEEGLLTSSTLVPLKVTDVSNRVKVVYSSEGSLGLEFDQTDFPFRISGVVPDSYSSHLGVRAGDCLVSVNGRATEGMAWKELRVELSKRPAEAVFERSVEGSPKVVSSNSPKQPTSVWDFAAGLIVPSGEQTSPSSSEVAELRRIIEHLRSEDVDGLKQKALQVDELLLKVQEGERKLCELEKKMASISSELQQEKTRVADLTEVITEMETTHGEVVARYETSIAERSKREEVLVKELAEKAEQIEMAAKIAVVSIPSDETLIESLQASIASAESRIELIEKDNTRLRKENTELGVMVQQCLEKIQKDLADKPHWVDRRVVCAAVGALLKDMDAGNDFVAKQRLGDVLGLTHEERENMGLLLQGKKNSKHSIGEDFLTFLENEIAKGKKPSEQQNEEQAEQPPTGSPK